MTNSGEWAQREISLTRQYVAKEINSFDYGGAFMAAHNARADARELADDAMETLLDDLLYAVCNHTDDPDSASPDPLDDEQLRDRQARHLADWDDGTYAETWLEG
jgi:Bacterial self-protective colicin-like immunity